VNYFAIKPEGGMNLRVCLRITDSLLEISVDSGSETGIYVPKIAIFWRVTLCRLVDWYKRFRE
jgi:hypothetical protein